MANEYREKTGDILLRSGITAATGGAGAVLRRAADAATEESVDRAAKSLAGRIRQRTGAPAADAKKMTGYAFYVILGLVIFKDLSDIFADITIFLSAITPITSIAISFVLACYFYFNDIELSVNKVAAYIISLIVEFVPILNAIPTTTFILLLTKYLENRKTST